MQIPTFKIPSAIKGGFAVFSRKKIMEKNVISESDLFAKR